MYEGYGQTESSGSMTVTLVGEYQVGECCIWDFTGNAVCLYNVFRSCLLRNNGKWFASIESTPRIKMHFLSPPPPTQTVISVYLGVLFILYLCST